jgi:drug/metabolite transporter (DMT)-like permease
MTLRAIIAVVILLLAALLDGMRDSGIGRKSEVKWWPWHIVKWAGYYIPLVFIFVVGFWPISSSLSSPLNYISFILVGVILAIPGRILWQIGYKTTGPWFWARF